jgi:hypothetical protein
MTDCPAEHHELLFLVMIFFITAILRLLNEMHEIFGDLFFSLFHSNKKWEHDLCSGMN